MTIEEIKKSKKDILLATDIAEVLKMNPQRVRIRAREGLFDFKVIQSGSRIKIPRKPFLQYMGEL